MGELIRFRAFLRFKAVMAAGALGLAAIFVVPMMAVTCAPAPAAPPSPESVKDIPSLVACLNGNLTTGANATIADTVKCIPSGCTLTLTMSPKSAQAACSLGGGDGAGPRCQLPRVLINCPGPPPITPSFLLCPVGSVSEDVQGSNRMEFGQVIDDMGNMKMADIPVPPGPYTPLDASHVLSVEGGSKGCNQGCHDNPVEMPKEGDPELSTPINPFGNFGSTNLAPCIIATDEPGKEVEAGSCDGTPVTAESLSDICSCIDLGVNEDNHPLDSDQGRIVQLLCHALEDYQQTRGICGTNAAPVASGPVCTELDASCSPITGETVEDATGYVCSSVSGGALQCISDRKCESYEETGGGKFLVNAAVSMVRLQLSGKVATTGGPDSFVDSSDISGTLTAFNYLTRTLVQSVAFSSFQAQLTGGDFMASGKGTALVNGVPANIEFETNQSGGAVTFEVRDADTMELLAGGTGEDDRAMFGLTVTP